MVSLNGTQITIPQNTLIADEKQLTIMSHFKGTFIFISVRKVTLSNEKSLIYGGITEEFNNIKKFGQVICTNKHELQ